MAHSAPPHPLAGKQFTVTFDARGWATVTGSGVPAVTVEPVREESTVVINTHSTWPPMYVFSEADARGYLATATGHYRVLSESVPVRWCLEDGRGFSDLAEVIQFATVVGVRVPEDDVVVAVCQCAGVATCQSVIRGGEQVSVCARCGGDHPGVESADPLAGLHKDTVWSLIRQARLFIDPVSGEYRSTPPTEHVDPRFTVVKHTYVSGRDLMAWPNKVARFREHWEVRPESVRAEILRRAFTEED